MKTFSFEIEYDQYAENPRDMFDHISTFYAARNSHYITGGKKDVEYNYRDDLNEQIAQLRKEKAIIVEFEHYHAGTCYAVVERDQLQEEYLKHGYSMRKALYWARRCAQGEINEFLAWAEGEVYGFIVKDDEGEELDSCWGFYGDDGRKDAEEEAKSLIKYYEEEEQKQEDLLTSRLEFAANL